VGIEGQDAGFAPGRPRALSRDREDALVPHVDAIEVADREGRVAR
jgi:hypothetical protein